MAIHGKQLKSASIDLSKLDGIAASPDADKLLLSAATGAAQLLSVGGDLQASVSGTTLDFQIVDGTVTFANLTDAAVINQSETIATSSSDTSLPTSAAVKDYVDAQVSASVSGSSLELTAGTGSASIALATETLSFVGGSNLSTVANSTLNSLTVSLDSHISLASATLSGALSVGGNAVITGDLTVQGTTTTVNSTVVEIADPTFRLAAGTSTPATLNAASAGIVFGEDAAGISFALDAGGDFASTQSIDLASGEVYKIGNVDVLSVDGAAKVQDAVAGAGLSATSGVLATTRNIDLTLTADTASNAVITTLSADNVATAVAGLIELRINGISYEKGTSSTGDWYLDSKDLTWNATNAGFHIDSNDRIELITYS